MGGMQTVSTQQPLLVPLPFLLLVILSEAKNPRILLLLLPFAFVFALSFP